MRRNFHRRRLIDHYSITLSAELEGEVAVVTVRDNGIGIPSESIPRLFELFSQVDRSLERAQGGLGIGLALVKGLTEAHVIVKTTLKQFDESLGWTWRPHSLKSALSQPLSGNRVRGGDV